MPGIRIFAVLAWLLCLAGADSPSPGVAQTVPPSKVCATCHRAEAASQPTTLMAHALELSAANPILQHHPKLTFRRGDFSYSVTTQNAVSTYSVTDGAHTLSVPIVWGLGAGAQTWLLSLDGKFYESLVSYFPDINGLDTTLGDDVLEPKNLIAAMGRPLAQQAVKSCLGCHTTGAIVDGKLDLTALRPGVTCEHCHQGASTHMADAMHSQFSTIPVKLGAISSEALSNFCGQCHRSWSTVVTHAWFGEMNVRFAPYRLANSKCFNGADPRISCVACHNPHLNLPTDVASYDSKCLACHTGHPAGTGLPQSQEPLAKVCHVSKSNCVSCHMPKVTMANRHLTFTDHFIRIVKPGAPYPD
jgi:hypothetical protein